MAKTTKTTEKKILLRLPIHLWKKVLNGSSQNSRSVNGEIVHTLREKFEE